MHSGRPFCCSFGPWHLLFPLPQIPTWRIAPCYSAPYSNLHPQETFSDKSRQHPTPSLFICFIFTYSSYHLLTEVIIYIDIFTVDHPCWNASSISFGPCCILRINEYIKRGSRRDIGLSSPGKWEASSAVIDQDGKYRRRKDFEKEEEVSFQHLCLWY